VTVRNFGPQDAPRVVVRHTLPSASEFLSANSDAIGEAGGNCEFAAIGETGTLTCRLGTLAPGASVTITVVLNVTAPAGAVIESTADVSSLYADPNVGNNWATSRVFVA
jgi:hypothetical protein